MVKSKMTQQEQEEQQEQRGENIEPITYGFAVGKNTRQSLKLFMLRAQEVVLTICQTDPLDMTAERPFKYCNCTQGYEPTCGPVFEDMMRCVPSHCLCPGNRRVRLTDALKHRVTKRLRYSDKLT